MLNKYFDKDVDLDILKDKVVAVIGYGSQGEAQAKCFRDSGLSVVVGLRQGKSFVKAEEEGFEVLSIEEACVKADIIHILIPDEVQKEVFEQSIKKNLNANKTLSFSHGFSITYDLIKVPEGVSVVMYAPLGPGPEVRKRFLEGGGVPGLVAGKEDIGIGLALAKACGSTRVGVFECTFEQETYQDLFSEQVVLCGGMIELIKTAYDVLIEKGYPEELAYFCLYESNLITKLINERGVEGMYEKVSNTAEFGGRKVGKKLIDDSVKGKIKEVLNDIEIGKFTKEWIEDVSNDNVKLKKMRDKKSSIDEVGDKMRKFL